MHLPAPVFQLLCENAVHILRVSAHRFRLERDAERAAVHAVMVKIHEHKSAREQQVQDWSPPLFGRKELVAVKQHQFIGFCPDHRNRRITECISAEHLAIGFHHMRAIARRVAEHAKGCTDNRQSVFTGNMGQVANFRAGHPMRVGCFAMGQGHIDNPLLIVRLNLTATDVSRVQAAIPELVHHERQPTKIFTCNSTAGP